MKTHRQRTRIPMVRRSSQVRMAGRLDWNEGQHDRVIAWLMLLLRFAITRAATDRVTLMSQAAELDSLGGPNQVFSYFARTSSTICAAIGKPAHDSSRSVLSAHAARIADQRLRAAFCACLDIPDERSARRDRLKAAGRDKRDLWKGLRDR